MKKKQIIGLLIAALVFVFVCVSSIITKQLSNQLLGETTTEASLESVKDIFAAKEVTFDLPINPYVAVVRVEGAIMGTDETASLFSTGVGYNHSLTLDYIDELIASGTNQGLVLYVDSPGGTVYHSDELYLKLMEYKEKTSRPVWTYMASQACSGGYYISMASDKIFTNRNCWTGSIGVIISLTNYKELLDKLGIREVDIVSGPNKAMGSAGLEMTEEQEAILQSLVDESYEQFTQIVADGRGMDLRTVKQLADGRIYTAQQALETGLIDEIASWDETKQAISEQFGAEIEFYEYTASTNPWEMLFSYSSQLKQNSAKSEAEVLLDYIQKEGKGVPMYYAKP